MRVLVIVFVGLIVGVQAAAAQLMAVQGQRPTRIVATRDGRDAGDLLGESRMLMQLAGVVGVYSGRDVSQVLACEPRRVEPRPLAPDAELVGVLDLEAPRGRKRVLLMRGGDGAVMAHDEADASGRGVELDYERVTALMGKWPLFLGPFGAGEEGGAEDVPPGEVVSLARPYREARVNLDARMLKDRFYRNQRGAIVGHDRNLEVDELFVRLPVGLDSREPAGVLVWISPTPRGEPPRSLHAACDEFGLIAVGAADAGNSRLSYSRYQLALDGIENVMARWHVDPERVYVTGMSGGGKTASALAVCMPEVFRGGVSIVGLGNYFNVPVGNGRFIAATFSRPRGKVLTEARDRPLAVMSGEPDFNYQYILPKVARMKRDGFQVRLFDYPDMGHVMPTPDRFVDAMRWVDEPAQEARREREELAQRLLDRYVEAFGEVRPEGARGREQLVKVTEVGPWSEAAWRAVGILGAGE